MPVYIYQPACVQSFYLRMNNNLGDYGKKLQMKFYSFTVGK